PPPIDESLDAAWERAKLTAPPESPHFSRAAAGSIIGVALAVILGALAFNFRQDIGELVIAAGQKISGQDHSASPAPVSVSDQPSGSKSDAQPATNPSGSDSSTAANKPDTSAPSGAARGSTNPASGPAKSAADTAANNAEAQPSTTSGTARDGNSAA